MGLASASAIMMFITVSAIVVPYLYSELRREDAAK
jgi:glucose/mannose transport system permease protein